LITKIRKGFENARVISLIVSVLFHIATQARSWFAGCKETMVIEGPVRQTANVENLCGNLFAACMETMVIEGSVRHGAEVASWQVACNLLRSNDVFSG